MKEEYVSYKVSKEVNDILGHSYCRNIFKTKPKCWRYPVNGSGGHASAPFIDDFYWDDDPFDDYDDTIFAFTWEDLYALMNKVVKGDFRKSEFESIEDINQFALELYDYVKEIERN